MTKRAAATLADDDPIHNWLWKAFGQRIDEALDGNAFQGPLDQALIDQLGSMERMDRYKIDYLRQHSRILEPHERIDPHRRYLQRYEDDLSKHLAHLHDVTDRDQLQSRVAKLVQQTAKNPVDSVRVLNAALELSPRLGEAAAQDLLADVLPAFQVASGAVERALLLTRGMSSAAHCGAVDHVQTFVAEFEKLLSEIVQTFLALRREQEQYKEKADTLEALFNDSLRGLRRLGMRDEVGRLFGRIAEIVGQEVQKAARGKKKNDAELEKTRARARRLLLTVAGGWFYFGQLEQAQEIVSEVRGVLFEGKSPPMEQKNLAYAYVTAVGQAPSEAAFPLLLELFETSGKEKLRKLPGIEDPMNTSTHFSISQFDLVESVVLTLVSDDFSLNADSRRWLDEDEFLVRRRIHHDVQDAMRHT